MNKKILLLIFSLVLAGAAQAQDDGLDALMAAMIAAKIHQDSIDVSSLVAVYDYECQTQDADGKAVTDRMKLCVQVGQHCTRCFPYRKFREDTEGYDYMTGEELPNFKAESYCFMPEVWTGYPEGQVTVRDAIIPTIYETREERKSIGWTLCEDTMTVSGYLCKTATGELHGRTWTVRYAEDIPTSAGPWKLCGLPGLILDAVSDGGIHRFTLGQLNPIVTPIYYEHNAITKKIPEEKLIRNRIKTFGNRLYPKQPTYYMPNHDALSADEIFCQIGDEVFCIVNGVLKMDEAHVYQPLELK
jgi:GLPGLI family protein